MVIRNTNSYFELIRQRESIDATVIILAHKSSLEKNYVTVTTHENNSKVYYFHETFFSLFGNKNDLVQELRKHYFYFCDLIS